MIKFLKQKRLRTLIASLFLSHHCYSIITFSFIVLLTMQLSACNSSAETELQHYINEVNSRPGRPIPPIPTFAALPKFTYPEKDTRRNPFKPTVTRQESVKAPNLNRPRQALEAFPLDALKFVGILKEGPVIWALIRQPNGLITRVKQGDYMGKNFGQIKKISEKIIALEETVKVSGKLEKKRITLRLSGS